MVERDLTETEHEIDITRIDFPRVIDETEADKLIRYFVAQMDEECGSVYSISINLTQNRNYGEILKKTVYESIDSVRVRNGDTKLTGRVTSTIPLNSASFEFKNGYNRLELPAFTGIRFSVTPGYEPGELSSDSIVIMKNLRKYAESYFKKADRV